MPTRYFVIEPAKLEPTGMILVQDDPDKVVLSYFNRAEKKWVPDPNLIRYFEGSQPDIREISKPAAIAILRSWS